MRLRPKRALGNIRPEKQEDRRPTLPGYGRVGLDWGSSAISYPKVLRSLPRW